MAEVGKIRLRLEGRGGAVIRSSPYRLEAGPGGCSCRLRVRAIATPLARRRCPALRRAFSFAGFLCVLGKLPPQSLPSSPAKVGDPVPTGRVMGASAGLPAFAGNDDGDVARLLTTEMRVQDYACNAVTAGADVSSRRCRLHVHESGAKSRAAAVLLGTIHGPVTR